MHISIKNLSKTYRGDVKALQNVNLSIPQGMFGLLGPNGAGKTTLMRILAGILQPTKGLLSIGEYDGTTEKGRQAIKRTLGYLPQDLGMYPDLSAREFLDYIAILKGINHRATRQTRVAELLEMVALSNVAKRKIKTFSGGMKRRVGIAQALLNDPQLLIVDEPTAGLDPEERIRFRNLLSDLGGQRTILLSTHIIEDIAQTCQNLALMHSGQVIFHGTIAQMVQHARGKVWLVTTSGPKPQGNYTIASTLNMGNATQYRLVGEVYPQPGVTPVEPGLEDSYIWMMHAQKPFSSPATRT
ncbi:MAG TPA: ABC transporter ATP-binding protein [Ktedonobacteraceae bacterium]|nr:ABC transporter ATP-binding protein [Ktedonobacteraceae bacterium]